MPRTWTLRYFNPRPPRGGRPEIINCAKVGVLFQSTPSARRATLAHFLTFLAGYEFQSTPSARRATQRYPNWLCVQGISIHALREEGDPHQNECACGLPEFQSTPSARRATLVVSDDLRRGLISIHALREEGDSKSGEKIHHVCSIIHTCAQFEKELYEGSGEMQNKSC